MKSHSYRVGIRTCSDYSPFGVELDGRTVSGGYRFGYNTQEKTDEIAGSGNHTTALFWEYDSRSGRRWNTDPIIFFCQSSYSVNFNNSIVFTDPFGLFGSRGEASEYKKTNGLSGSIRKQDDGTFAINNKKDGTSYFRDYSLVGKTVTGRQKDGVIKGILVNQNSEKKEGGLKSLLAGGWAAAIVEPTPFGEAAMAIITGITIFYYGPNLVNKMQKEIDGIRRRSVGPPGFQYALIATRSGPYPNVNSGTTLLKVGEVWKYGETTKGFGRYPEKFYVSMGLTMIPQFYGNQIEIKIQEKIMIYSYFMKNGSLPPGNSIFR